LDKEAHLPWRAFLANKKTTMRMLANQRYVTEAKFKGKKEIVLNAVYGSVDEIFSRMEVRVACDRNPARSRRGTEARSIV
jgi:hypothetical protein